MPDASHKAYRCSKCDHDWPMNTDYRACPLCGDATWETGHTIALSAAEAKIVIDNHEKLQEAYQRHDDAKYAAEVAEAMKDFDSEVSSLLC